MQLWATACGRPCSQSIWLLHFIGVVVGLFVGAMPGLGSVNGVAILLPFTFVIQKYTGTATSPMIFLAAIYYGAMYGGAISSITLGIPGASTAVATTFDGRPLALSGRADQALVAAAVASFVGGTVANLLFTGFAPALASVALDFRQSGNIRLDAAGVRDVCRTGR